MKLTNLEKEIICVSLDYYILKNPKPNIIMALTLVKNKIKKGDGN